MPGSAFTADSMRFWTYFTKSSALWRLALAQQRACTQYDALGANARQRRLAPSWQHQVSFFFFCTNSAKFV
ncbi:uncharacterized protein DS421_16g547200 [Arachis hypogaea]|nr:uncharacterized protein DS421_16g547200 [Arachis hypogaea]